VSLVVTDLLKTPKSRNPPAGRLAPIWPGKIARIFPNPDPDWAGIGKLSGISLRFMMNEYLARISGPRNRGIPTVPTLAVTGPGGVCRFMVGLIQLASRFRPAVPESADRVRTGQFSLQDHLPLSQ
jgi:hypothetical protein